MEHESKEKNKYSGGGGNTLEISQDNQGKPPKKPKKKYIIAVVAVLLVYGLLTNNSKDDTEEVISDITTENVADTMQTEESEETESTQEAESIQETESVQETTETLSTEDIIRAAVENVVGMDNLETLNYVPSNNFCLIKFRGSENITDNLTVKGMYLDMFDILKAIQTDIDTDVDFNVVYPMVDIYGNTEDVIVIKATFTNDTIKKINFENAIWNNIPQMADEWWNHTAVTITD